MTQTLDLSKMGLMPMNEFEMMKMEGGSPWWWDAAKAWGAEKIFDASLAFVIGAAKNATHNSNNNASWIDK